MASYPVAMDVKHLAFVPLGKIDRPDLEPVLQRAVKTLRQPVELRPRIDLPTGIEDPTRKQFRAAKLIQTLHEQRFRVTKSGQMIGDPDGNTIPRGKPELWIYITDADLYTAKTDGVFAALSRKSDTAVVSVKRLREAFYRRPADENKQRSRLIKEILRMFGRLNGLPQCPDPTCVMSISRGVPDLDTKREMYCRACASVLFEGRIQI